MMKDKKNIEKLFKEKLQDFEVNPPESAWQNISERLKNKKRRRVLPFWLKSAGIAASLIVGFIYFNSITTSGDQHKTNDALTTVNQDSENQNSNSVIITDTNDLVKDNSVNVPEDQFATQNKTTNSSVIRPNDSRRTLSNEEQDNIATTHNSTNINSSKNSNASDNSDTSHKRSQFNLNIDSESISHSNAPSKDAKGIQNIVLNSFNNPSDKDAINKNITSVEINNKVINSNQTIENEEPIVAEETTNIEDDAFTEYFAKLEQDKESEKEKDENANFSRWKITPNVAPIAFNSFSDGSPISEQFANNSKDYLNSISVGLGVNYALTEKISMRTGINKFLVGYNTNDVAFYASVNASEIISNNLNVNFAGNTSNIVLKPENILVIHNESSSQHIGHINQKIGFIEVPLEFSYKLLNSKFNIDVIGGMSTLFLQENEVSVVSNGMQAVLGEANNLNDVHFSTNFGIGFRYEIFKSFEASVEPMFKYQIGTFSKNDGNFKPYILGVYTGLSFKF